MKLSLDEAKRLVRLALREDVGSGDITTQATVPAGIKAKGRIVAKERGVMAGLKIAELAFKMVKRRERIQFKARVKEGDKIKRGQVVAEISGSARSILMAERTALNFLQRLSGIATLTAEFVDKVSPCKVKIMDTRKTTPGWRALEKYAVRVGGGYNHRRGLDDGVLIKDNHIRVRSYTLPLLYPYTPLIPFPYTLTGTGGHRRAQAGTGELRVVSEKKRRETAIIEEMIRLVRKKVSPRMKIEVEVRSLREVKEAVRAGADIIMLDNMNRGQIKKAVKIAHLLTLKYRPLLEASGGINLHNVKEIANTGVDMISVGALTHSAKGLDMSLEIIKCSSA